MLASQGCRTASFVALPVSRATTDPLSGFFAVRREVLAEASLKPIGYKILLEVLIRGSWRHLVDVPYEFRDRSNGESKSGLAEAIRFVRHLALLRRRQPATSAAGASELTTEAEHRLLESAQVTGNIAMQDANALRI